MKLGAGVAVFAIVLASPCAAEAVSCRGYPESVRSLIKSRVEALRMIEREAADRLVGLDTRTFPFLAGELRKAADIIATPADLADEEGLKSCRNLVHPVRSICRAAALALATVLDEHEAGTAGKDAKATYTEAMPRCERLMNLPPLSTSIRMVN